MRNSVLAALGAALVATLGAGSVAQAATIDFGVVAIGGTLSYAGTTLSGSTALDLDSALLLVSETGATDASGLSAGSSTVTVSPTDVVYGSAPGTLATPVVKTWSDSLGDFTETLTSVLSINRATANAITVTLEGSLIGPGFPSGSPAFLILSANQAGGPGNVVSASFTNTSSLTIPETSTWAMMALGFAALGYAASRRRKTNIAMLSA